MRTTLLVLAGALALGSAAALAESNNHLPGSAGQMGHRMPGFACPLQTAETRIVSNLPADWWETPQEGDLKNVKIETIAGTPTMLCGYGAYGTTVYVMHKVPAHQTCFPNPARDGFECR